MPKIKALGIFLVGLVCGMGVMLVGVALGPNRIIQDLWGAMISEHALHAKMIHDGQAPQVQRMIETTFVGSAQGLRQLGLPKHTQDAALWDIRSYYELTGKPIPTELRELLASLPSKPPSSCRIKRELQIE